MRKTKPEAADFKKWVIYLNFNWQFSPCTPIHPFI